LFNEEKLKAIFQQNWIVLTRKSQFRRKINNALFSNSYQVSPIFSNIFVIRPTGVAQMARAFRIQYPGAFYHVMHRGNAGSDLFKTESDRRIFLEYLRQAVQR